ncbi:MAG: DUF1552 domain-containing protein [Byssovorax sp.]
MSLRPSTRRSFLRSLGAAALALPFYQLLDGKVARAGGVARRVIFFYFPDGVSVGADGDLATSFHPVGAESDFQLSAQLEPLSAFKNDCVFLKGLTLGLSDGSHDDGAQKLLTNVFGGKGESLDHYLAYSPAGDAPYRHLYLGAMALRDNSSSKGISYPGYGGGGNNGVPLTPQDNPRQVFESIFNAPAGGGMGGQTGAPDPVKVSVIDGVLADMNALKADLGAVEGQKLDAHLAALREVEKRIKGDGTMNVPPPATCKSPLVDMSQFNDADCTMSYADDKFPFILKAQIDVMVLAMACGQSKVGLLQASHHTANELDMAMFPNTEMAMLHQHMRSHEASHNSQKDHIAQRRWFMTQFAYLLDRLKSTPEPGGSGTMLESSLVLACSEIASGPQHTHWNMPFVLAGGAGGAVKTGRLLQYNDMSHGALLVSIAQAMGQNINGFGEWNGGGLPGLLS